MTTEEKARALGASKESSERLRQQIAEAIIILMKFRPEAEWLSGSSHAELKRVIGLIVSALHPSSALSSEERHHLTGLLGGLTLRLCDLLEMHMYAAEVDRATEADHA